MSLEESLKIIKKNDFVKIEIFDRCFLFVFFVSYHKERLHYSLMFDDINKCLYTYHSIDLKNIVSIKKIGTLEDLLFLK